MDDKLKEKLDTAIEDAVKEAKPEEKEEISKRSVVFAPPQIIRATDKDDKFSYARLIKAMVDGRWAEAPFEKQAIEKALGEASDPTGGYLVPEEYSAELIDMLKAKTVIRQAGARVYPMARQILEIPRVTAASTTYWGAENVEKDPGDTIRFGNIKLIAKKLYCLIPISAELIADSSPAVEAVVRRDMVEEISLAEDLAYLQGAGVGSEPQGLINITGINAITGPPTLANLTYDHLMDMMFEVENDNARVTGWIFHPEVKNTLRKMQDSNGRYIYAVDLAAKIPESLLGLPVFMTTQIPRATTTNGYIICGDFTQCIIGQRQTIELKASEHVGFKSDQIYLRATMRVDFNVRHPEAFCKLAFTG